MSRGGEVLLFDEVSYGYPDGRRRALEKVSFSLGGGRMLGVLGANGSGKSTLALLAAGLVSPSSGVVTITDHSASLASRSMIDAATGVALMLQNADNSIVGDTVLDDVAFGFVVKGCSSREAQDAGRRALESTGLEGLADRPTYALSDGEKQAVLFSALLALRPGYLVLDEPTTFLDPDTRDKLLGQAELARRGGVGIILVTQRAEEVASADEVIVLRDGRVASRGTPAEVLLDLEGLEACGVTPPLLAYECRAAGLGSEHFLNRPALTASNVAEAICSLLK